MQDGKIICLTAPRGIGANPLAHTAKTICASDVWRAEAAERPARAARGRNKTAADRRAVLFHLAGSSIAVLRDDLVLDGLALLVDDA